MSKPPGHYPSIRLAIAAAMLSIPTLVDILFAITFIHDSLNFIFMGALLLSFALAVSSVGVALISTQNNRSVIVTIAIALTPLVVVGMGALPIAGILRPLVGLDPLR